MIIDNLQMLRYQEQAYKAVSEICIPLTKHFCITFFCYIRVYPDSRYFSLHNNSTWAEFYLNNINSEKIIWDNEIHFNPLHKYGSPIPVLWPAKPDSFLTEQLFEHNIWNGIHFTNFTQDYSEFWAFAGDKSNENLKYFYLKNLELLYKFIAHFTEKAQSYLKPKKDIFATYKEGIDYPTYWPKPNHNIKEVFLKEIGVFNKYFSFAYSKNKVLSKREIECLYYLTQGKSAKEIGKSLHISYRTVEIHLQNIKLKSGYSSRSDLVKFFQDVFF